MKKEPKFTPEEIENSNRIYKSATPKQDLSWYVKWVSCALVLLAVVIRSAGIPEYQIWDVTFSLLGTIGWLFVGLMWKDRALIILNAVIVIMLASALLRHFAA